VPVERSSGTAETEALGVRLAALLEPGDLVLVEGELGAGKTTLIRGTCRALGVTEPVTSPTFTIGRRYKGSRMDVSHLDLYRLDSLEAEVPGLLDDYLTPDAVCLVEWAGRAVADLPTARLRVRMEHAGENERRIAWEEI
jgi:tRNA threonylcarbamoyladenosine biosynthesis protein TsaE